ncbi:MAG: Dabb family protein [Spirochaetaceae bacterium]
MIKHLVLFSFKPETTKNKILEVDNLFMQLPQLIDVIIGFESGLNISPENLNKGFTHAYQITFKSEETRDIYLIHDDHKAFSKVVTELISDVLVLDYSI